MTATTPIWWWRPTRARRPSPTSPTGGRGIRLLARRRLRVGRLAGLRPQGHGHHRARRLGIGQAPFPGARRGLPGDGFHRGRHRRHGRRRVRQCDAAVPAYPARGGLQPHAHLHRPGPGRRSRLRGAPAAVRPAPLNLGRFRPQGPLRRRRRLSEKRQVRPAQPGGAGGARHRRRGPDPDRAHRPHPQGAGRSALERRHRHLCQVAARKPRRCRRPGQ